MRGSAPYQRHHHFTLRVSKTHNDYFQEYSSIVKPTNKLVYTELRALLLLYLKCKPQPKITKYLRYIYHSEKKNKDKKRGNKRL